jgi:hypothetical protein
MPADHIAICPYWVSVVFTQPESTPVVENSAPNFRKWPAKQIYLGYDDSTARFK